MTGVTWRHVAAFAFLILALGLGGPTPAAAEALATISAAPSPFGSGATITIDASITGQWQGEPPTSCQPPDCQMGEVLDVDTHIVVEGSTGFYASYDAWGTHTASVQWYDSIPGQVMTATTYTLTGQVVWTVCTYWWFDPETCYEAQVVENGGDSTAVQPSVVPVSDWVSPNSGSGPSQTFTFQYSSSAGAGDIHETWQVFHQTGSTTSSCVVGVYTQTSTIVLWHDSGPGQDSSAALGAPAVLENSQCRVFAAGASQSTAGNTRSVIIPVSFKGEYAGDKHLYMWAKNAGGAYSSATDKGDWTARAQVGLLSPSAGGVETEVTITGDGFGTTWGTVAINGMTASVSQWTETSIVAVVQPGTTSGNLVVTTNGQASNGLPFTVQTGPIITSLSQTFGPVMTWVTVTGSGFGVTKGTSKVQFNGVNAGAYNGWSDTVILARVPASATAGLVKVLKKPENVLSNGIPFTVGTEEIRYHHSDGIGSVRMVTGHEGYVWERHDYQPFGVEMPPAEGDESVRFAGKEHDEETGASTWMALDYFGARYLHGATGRFTAVDPLMLFDRNIEDPQSWNRYTYVRNNPVRYVDPDGRYWDLLWDVPLTLYSAYECLSGQGCGNLAVDGLAAVVPGLPAGTTRFARATGNIVDGSRAGKAAVKTVGQEHHIISRRIHEALEENPSLAGKYTARDPRFVTQAVDEASHRGYQRWHRQVDQDVVDWIGRNPEATTEQFENYLRELYSRSDLAASFPNGF